MPGGVRHCYLIDGRHLEANAAQVVSLRASIGLPANLTVATRALERWASDLGSDGPGSIDFEESSGALEDEVYSWVVLTYRIF